MNHTFAFIRGIIILVVFTCLFGWFAWWRFKESANRGAMVVRWTLTAGLLGVLGGYCAPKFAQSFDAQSPVAVYIFLLSVVIGLVMAIIWVPEIVGTVGDWFGSLYTGGNAPDDPKPFYSIALAQRTQGHYKQSLVEVRKQLERFPLDFEGQMLMASLQAENLNDLPEAETTIANFCAQPGHSPINIAYALNLLADWHLKINKDRDAARGSLEKIIELAPDSEMALQAAQRIGRLADTEHLLEPSERKRIHLPHGADNIGLMTSSKELVPEEIDPVKLAAEYVRHLQVHPLDGHIRERLAILYANHYQRLDLAADQLDQLIQMPNQTKKQIVHWLNLLADLQVKNGAPIEAAQATLQRIIDQYPDLAAATNTRRRIDLLRLEYKALGKADEVQLGEYEQNIGLKRYAEDPPK